MQNKRILPPAYFMSSIFLVAIVHFILPITKLIYFPCNPLGVPLLAFDEVDKMAGEFGFEFLEKFTTKKGITYNFIRKYANRAS